MRVTQAQLDRCSYADQCFQTLQDKMKCQVKGCEQKLHVACQRFVESKDWIPEFSFRMCMEHYDEAVKESKEAKRDNRPTKANFGHVLEDGSYVGGQPAWECDGRAPQACGVGLSH